MSKMKNKNCGGLAGLAEWQRGKRNLYEIKK